LCQYLKLISFRNTILFSLILTKNYDFLSTLTAKIDWWNITWNEQLLLESTICRLDVQTVNDDGTNSCSNIGFCVASDSKDISWFGIVFSNLKGKVTMYLALTKTWMLNLNILSHLRMTFAVTKAVAMTKEPIQRFSCENAALS